MKEFTHHLDADIRNVYARLARGFESPLVYVYTCQGIRQIIYRAKPLQGEKSPVMM
jgi:hypothetical protein